MEENFSEQLEDFNELINIGNGILSAMEEEINTAHADLGSALAELKRVSDEATTTKHKLLEELTNTKQNLSSELAKSQEARRNLESEKEYLRGENSKLNSTNQRLALSLRESQGEIGELKRKIAQVQKFLAG